jgi:hypothetical protein
LNGKAYRRPLAWALASVSAEIQMIDKSKTKRVKVKRNIYEHLYLGSIALNQLEQAKTEEDGHRFRWIIPSMTFSVFRVEALCNIYGGQLFPHWTHFESMSFIGKIAMISESLSIEVNFSAEPWQILDKMKRFRNDLAHTKPQKVSEIHEVPESFPENLVPFPQDRKTILSYSTIENAERFEEVATELDTMWRQGAKVLGRLVDTVGVPTCKIID